MVAVGLVRFICHFFTVLAYTIVIKYREHESQACKNQDK